MKRNAGVLGVGGLIIISIITQVHGANWYVATNGSDSAAGTNWDTAKLTIQAGVDVAVSNDTVWVSNGVYATGGRVAIGSLTNRVVIIKPLRVQSVNGPEVTVIRGAWDTTVRSDGLGNAAVRCAYMSSSAVLSGFTLTNGATRWAHPAYIDSHAGGAQCDYTAVLTNCILSGNRAVNGGGAMFGTLNNCLLVGNWTYYNGGGTYNSTLSNCTVAGNSANGFGGGAIYGTLNNCLLVGNRTSSDGGGTYNSTLNNCTVAGNSANGFGGGAMQGTLNNCVVTDNTAAAAPNHTNCTCSHSCTMPDPGGTGNITNDPQFVDSGAGDYHLNSGSPCIDAGKNSDVQGTADLDGHPRIVNGVVDMGAYEAPTALAILPASTNLFITAWSGRTIEVTAKVPWTATTNVPWLAITSGDSGTTNGTVVFDVAADDDASSRTGTVVVAGGGLFRTCTVVQTAFVPSLSVAPASTSVTFAATSGISIAVTANVAWTAATNAPWLAITSGDSGTTNGTVVFSADANDALVPRTGAIIISGEGLALTCTVAQAVFVPMLEIVPASTNLSCDAASGIAIEVTANMSWAAMTNVPWLTITPGESRAANETVVFSVAANKALVPRTGAIIISGGELALTCTVTQAAREIPAADWFVATNGNDSADGTNWATAKLTIQAAVDAATTGNTVWVSNGVYAGLVTLNKGIGVQSVNGADVTTIQGCSTSRCVTLSNALAVISGFTLTGGRADWGGGAYIDAGTLEDCMIHDNVAAGRTSTSCDPGGHHCVESGSAYGGGVYGGTLRNCDIYLNEAHSYVSSELGSSHAAGGGTYQSDLSNCSVRDNTAYAGSYQSASAQGGGTFAGANRNCTIVGNYAGAQAPSASASGGGCNGSANFNSIIYANTSYAYPGEEASDNIAGGSSSNSCSPGLATGGGNITNDPLFVAAAADNYRLRTNSPCIDAGNNADVMGTTDLDGNPRIANGTVDMGAYEGGHMRVPVAWHVATNGNDSADGASWETAKLTIQAGVDAASDGDTIWVSNGVYATGGGRAAAVTHTNRVVIDRPVTVRSVNGPETTFIVGGGMRCVYVGNDAVLSGFTLTNGTTASGCGFLSGDINHQGGGVRCEDSGMVTNCVLTGNWACYQGGGSSGGRLYNCILRGNSSQNFGGGSEGSTLNQCVLTGNSAFMQGGGANGGTLNNCLLIGNHASYGAGAAGVALNNCTVAGNWGDEGGGVAWSTLKNSIVYGNTGNGDLANYRECSFTNSCTAPMPTGLGNITNDPQFVNSGAGNYRLGGNSPCCNAGNNAYATGKTDLDGNPRIFNGTVDMGAYEVQNTASYATWAAGITNGLTNATDCAAGDGIPNLLRYAAGSSDPMLPDDLSALGAVIGGELQLIFNRNPDATDLNLIVEGTDAMVDGAAWRGIATNSGGSWLGATNVDESVTGNPVVCTVTDPVALESNRFLRLRVSRP